MRPSSHGTLCVCVFLTVVCVLSAPIDIGLLEDEITKNLPVNCKYSFNVHGISINVNIFCQDIGKDYVPPITNLATYLNMKFNNIPVINIETLENANRPNLREVNLSNCRTQSIHPDAFKDTNLCQHLQRIHLNNNELESLSDITIALNTCTSLIFIDARHSTREPPKNGECAEMKNTFPDAVVLCDETIAEIMPTASRPTLETSSSTTVPELKTTTEERLTTHVQQKEEDEVEEPNTAMLIGLIFISFLLVITVAVLIYKLVTRIRNKRLQGENIGESSDSLIP